MKPEIFERAADLLEEKGWTRLNYCKGERRCALGALYEVLGEDLGIPAEERWRESPVAEDYLNPHRTILDLDERYRYEAELLDTINEGHYRARFFDIPDWNDETSRRREQVVRAFRKTAERVRNAE